MKGIFARRTINIRNPEAVRPWQHVLDPLSGYIMLAEKLESEPIKFSGAWNFGPNDENVVPVSVIIKKILDMWDDFDIENEKSAKYHEAEFLKLDYRKAQSMLGWNSKTNLENMIRLTLEWYRKYQLNEDINVVCEEQIRNHSSL